MANTAGLFRGSAGLYDGYAGLIKPCMILSTGTGLSRKTSGGSPPPPPPPPPSSVGQLDFTDANQSAWSWFF